MNKKAILVSIVVLIVFGVFSCLDHNKFKMVNHSEMVQNEGPMASMLENTLKNINDSVQLAFRGKKLFTSSLVKDFYSQNNNLPVWTSGMRPNHFATEMMRLFERVQCYGLDTSFYQYAELKGLYSSLKDNTGKTPKESALEYELLMTHNCFKLMSHLHAGLLYADTAVYGVNLAKYPSSFPEKLSQFISDDNLSAGILDMQPKSYEYKRLQKGLEQFINHIGLSTDSFQIPDPLKDSALAYQKAREILIAYNYLNPDAYLECRVHSLMDGYKQHGPNNEMEETSLLIYLNQDTLFVKALKEFQKDHGLSPDGKIGTNTKKALMINNRERFEQIAVNLERLRWEKNRPSRYVYVNIPAYRLRVLDQHKIIKTFNVVVGAKATETPLLKSQIEYFITNPEWNVPFSISSKELLPRLRKDSTYLARHNFRIYDRNRTRTGPIDWSSVDMSNYSIQQGGGSGNALGKIKFIFPNSYNVYIHDTQDKGKFKYDIRAFSHGCMRIQNPNEFAKVLLGLESNSMADSVDIWLGRSDQRRVNFPEPIPVFVRYVTCEANSKGQITFYQDIYGKDRKLKEQLFAKKDL